MKTFRIDDSTIIFQTNCLYTDEGQIIIARKSEDKSITFVDICRGIYGRCEPQTDLGPQLDAWNVNNLYLHNRYTLQADMLLVRELRELAQQHKHEVPHTRG